LRARQASAIVRVVERWSGGGDRCGEMTRVGSPRRSKMLECINASLSKQEMLEWLVVKIDELLAISVRIAAALESLSEETRQQRLLIADAVAATEVVVIEEVYYCQMCLP